jgi:hypothetical protein
MDASIRTKEADQLGRLFTSGSVGRCVGVESCQHLFELTFSIRAIVSIALKQLDGALLLLCLFSQ